MSEILVLVGVPGSGKSTFADEFVKSNPTYVKISKDDIRKMLKGVYWVGADIEVLVEQMQNAMIKAALDAKRSVILDNTHCKVKYINKIIKTFGTKATISIKFIGAELSLKEIKQRNLNRDKAVPEEVIDRMHKGFIEVSKSKQDFLKLMGEVLSVKGNFGKQDVSLPKAIIVDIDGTVAHMNGKRGPFDWKKVDVDDPDEHVLNLVRSLSTVYKVIFMSGRDESCRDLTSNWLDVYYGKEYEGLFMRKESDNRPDEIVKTELFEQHVKDKYYVEGVFDDRNKVVNMWRNQLGLKCLQVEEGNF